MAIQLEDEALALARHRRRLYHAPAKNYYFAPAGIDLRRGARCVYPRIECSREKESEEAAGARQPARSAPQRQQTQREEGGDGTE
jgi:hypothetical protein